MPSFLDIMASLTNGCSLLGWQDVLWIFCEAVASLNRWDRALHATRVVYLVPGMRE